MVRAVARFGRLTAAGLGLSCVVVGHASAAAGFPVYSIVGLLLVALAYHVVVFALNDLFDLEIDRTDPSRARSPLVAGTITPRAAALVIALIALASFAVDIAFFGFSMPAAGALGAAYVCLFLYDVYSKRLRWPVITDSVQGLGWACLVWYGAVRAGGAAAATVLACAFVFGFVVIVNGVHGGLRDIHNDSRRGARTTAITFGAVATADGLWVPTRLRAFAWLVQGGLAAVAVASPLAVRGEGRDPMLWYALALVTTGAAVLLLRAGLRSCADSARFKNLGAAHILALYVPLTAMTAMFGGWRHGAAALAAMALPMLGNESFRTAFRALPALAGISRARPSAYSHHNPPRRS